MKQIGIISDTHGLLRPQAIEALRGVDLILHAGDVGSMSIIDELRTIAPTEVVRGNTDTSLWALDMEKTKIVEFEGKLIYLVHDLSTMDLDPAAAGIRMVVYGHSHQPSIREDKGILYINPGSAGPPRFTLPITLARVRFYDQEEIVPEIVTLVKR